MEEVVIGSLRCASNHLNSVPETGGVSHVGEEHRDDTGFQQSNDIEVVER